MLKESNRFDHIQLLFPQIYSTLDVYNLQINIALVSSRTLSGDQRGITASWKTFHLPSPKHSNYYLFTGCWTSYLEANQAVQ